MYVSVRDRPGGQSPPKSGWALRRVAPTVLLLGIVSMLTDISSEMVNAILPIYLTAQVGLSILAYGFIDGIYQGVSALVRIAGGYAADSTDRPKWIATIGYGVSALSRIALLPAQGFLAITAVITADRLGKGLRTAPRDALIADASEPSMLGRAFGVHRALDTIGATLGPLVAFALLLAVPNGYSSIFVVSFAFAVIGFAVIVLFVPDRRTRSGKPRLRFSELLRTITSARLRGPLLASALLGLLTVGDGFLYLSLQQSNHLAAKYFPLLFIGTNAAYFLLAVPLGKLADRVGRARVLVGGHLALLAVYLIAGGPWGGMVPTIACLVLLGTFYAATDGVLPALVTRLVPEEARGSGIAAAQTVVALARFGASLGFGALWATTGQSQALLTVACLLVVALPAAAWLLRSQESQ